MRKIVMGCFDIEAVLLACVQNLFDGKNAVGISDSRKMSGWIPYLTYVTEIFRVTVASSAISGKQGLVGYIHI
jgi:hypothetical protein